MARFSKGVSGNPGGRPKMEGIVREAASKHAAKAVEALAKLLTHKSSYVRIAAAKELLDRAVGRPAQAVNFGDNDGGPLRPVINVTIKQLGSGSSG